VCPDHNFDSTDVQFHCYQLNGRTNKHLIHITKTLRKPVFRNMTLCHCVAACRLKPTGSQAAPVWSVWHLKLYSSVMHTSHLTRNVVRSVQRLRYWLGRPGLDYRLVQNIFTSQNPSSPPPRPTEPSLQGEPGVFPGCKGEGTQCCPLTLKIRVTVLLPPLHAFMAWTDTNLLLPFDSP
jgi:hypothetical protein